MTAILAAGTVPDDRAFSDFTPKKPENVFGGENAFCGKNWLFLGQRGVFTSVPERLPRIPRIQSRSLDFVTIRGKRRAECGEFVEEPGISGGVLPELFFSAACGSTLPVVPRSSDGGNAYKVSYRRCNDCRDNDSNSDEVVEVERVQGRESCYLQSPAPARPDPALCRILPGYFN